MLNNTTLKSLFQKEHSQILDDYFTFLRFPSLSADPAYRPHLLACANWLRSELTKIGMNVETWESDGGAPVLFGTYFVGPDKETILLYCHYDVQPVDPLELWTTPPFEPHIRDGKVFARGAVDDKGQCFYALRALKTLIEHSSLPVNIKFLIEGEEESGSHSLPKILKEKKEKLRAEHILIVDSGFQKGKPAISLGTRGLVTFTMTLKGSRFDLHSGTHGGIVYNPNRALVEMLSSLHDENGSVAIPGFYDDLHPLTDEEKKVFSFEFDGKIFEKDFGAKATGMEKGISPNESSWLRPTFEINGISGGYAGPGFKTVIPAKATAKFSCRLVPNQDPIKIIKRVEDELRKKVPPGIEMELTAHGSGRPYRTSPHSKVCRVVSEAYTQIFKKPCSYILMGGSIPIAVDLAEAAGGEMILIGVGLPTDQIHAPDEHFDLERLELGYLSLATALQLFGTC